MRRTVYLQRNEATNEFINSNVYAAWEGFGLLGYERVSFMRPQLQYLDVTKETVVVGWIGTVEEAFKIVGVESPPETSIPECLMKYAGRKIWESTLGEVRADDYFRHFIKPLHGHKSFTGHVRTGAVADLMATSVYPNEMPILCSEVVNFISEYRGFVLNGKLIGLKNYSGDFKKMIDVTQVESAIKDYKEAPCAYSIDFGLTDDGRTLLVEVNDSFALGSYGLHVMQYAQMIEARWDQIVGNHGI